MSDVKVEQRPGGTTPLEPGLPGGGGPTGGDGHGHGHGDGHGDELPHLPPPSIRPLIIGIGLLFIGFGLVYVGPNTIVGLVLLGIGLAIFGIGLGGWIYDDVRETRRQQTEGGHGHH